MKKLLMAVLLLLPAILLAQAEGENFCEEMAGGDYFPLTIEKKKLLWGDSFYFETREGKKNINGKEYITFKQVWKNGDTEVLYMRQDGTKVLQYNEETGTDTVRFDSSFPTGHIWHNADKSAKYTLLSFNSELRTRYCREYKGLMSVQAEYANVTYIFYYLKGYGYVGATYNGKLISCASPEW